jgi:putative ABC transport system permease protein
VTMFRALMQTASRIRAFFRRDDLDRDFADELDAHLAMLTDDNVRRGMSPEQARRAAIVRLGAPVSLREQHRAARGLPGVEGIAQDVRFAWRLIARDRWFSAAIVAALALGIGANTVGFTIVNATLLRRMSGENGDRLYMMSWRNRSGGRPNVSPAELQEWRARSRSFSSIAAYADATANISDDSAPPDQARLTSVTSNTFATLGQQPLLGRDFAADDERPGAEPVVILGYRIWRGRYAGDAAILGQTLRVNGQPATIIGVMPDGMRFPDNADLWRPFVPPDAQTGGTARRLRVFGVLKHGVDRRRADAELNDIAQGMITGAGDETSDFVGVRLETFSERFIGGAGRPMIYVVMTAVVFVLLIACANVANMLLSRSASRAREIAVRTAMGASRWRVLRQLLIESALLASIGGAGGLALAIAGVRTFANAMQQSGLPYWVVFSLDGVVLSYVALISLATTILFGLAPALHVLKTNTTVVLKDAGRGTFGSRRERWFSGGMVIAELALTFVLLAGSAVMVRSFLTLYSIDIGVDASQLMTMQLRLPASKYSNADARLFFERLEPRLTAIPGIEAAAVTTGVPSRDGGERLLETERTAGSTAPVFVSTVAITPQFFDVVRVPMVRGRNFRETDGAPGQQTVIVNERLAAQFFPGEDPIGRRLRFTQRQPAPGSRPDGWRTIVGISGRILHGSSLDLYENAVVYVPYRQQSPAEASLLVRTALPPASVMDAVRREVQAIDRDQPVYTIQTLTQLLEGDRWWYRTWGAVMAVLAAVALLLSIVGLYAVMAYAVTERTHEIGLRMAVGAQPRQVSWLILKRGLTQLAVALALGLMAALVLNRVLRLGLADLRSSDPATFAAIAALLTTVAVAACLVPARRATRIDPVAALRAN